MPNGVTLSYIDEEMAALMKAAGVDTLFLAIEHGSRRVLKDIIQKPIAHNRIRPTIAILQAAGIYCQGFFVIGLPGETRAERERRETRSWTGVSTGRRSTMRHRCAAANCSACAKQTAGSTKNTCRSALST